MNIGSYECVHSLSTLSEVIKREIAADLTEAQCVALVDEAKAAGAHIESRAERAAHMSNYIRTALKNES